MRQARAAEIADEVLFPAALEVDRADRVPAAHLDLLAAEGFYGITRSLEYPEWTGIVETLASGCLATAFVWIQHIGPALTAPGQVGRRRAGIAYAGLAPGSDLRLSGGRLSGHIPWVTGWGLIDVVQVAVRDGDVVRYFLIDAVDGPTLRSDLQRLVAVQASRTVALTFHDHPMGAEVHTEDYDTWAAQNASGAALNGFLALGLVRRVSLLLGGAFDGQLRACRAALLDNSNIPAARAAASELAYRAAGALAVETGSRAVLLDQTAQRLAREAAFLLVFGSRPAIKRELYARLAG
jgi:hypothetical protein